MTQSPGRKKGSVVERSSDFQDDGLFKFSHLKKKIHIYAIDTEASVGTWKRYHGIKRVRISRGRKRSPRILGKSFSQYLRLLLQEMGVPHVAEN